MDCAVEQHAVGRWHRSGMPLRQMVAHGGMAGAVMAGAMMAGVVLAGAATLVSCGGSAGVNNTEPDGRPKVVVSNTILADIVGRVAGDQVTIETLMPRGVDPHHFSASARQAASMESAALVVVNGGGFEAGMTRLLDTVEGDGANVFVATDHVELLGGQTDEPEPDGHESEHGAVDPHVWTDPHRMSIIAQALGETIEGLDGVDREAVATATSATVADLEALDREIASEVDNLSPDRRIMVTNHEAFNYYADRYGFTVVGTVIPSLSTNAEPSSRDIENLVSVVREYHVPAVFAETTSSSALASALTREVGEIDGAPVAVVELYAESLGEPGTPAGTYDGMMRLDTERIIAALDGLDTTVVPS